MHSIRFQNNGKPIETHELDKVISQHMVSAVSFDDYLEDARMNTGTPFHPLLSKVKLLYNRSLHIGVHEQTTAADEMNLWIAASI